MILRVVEVAEDAELLYYTGRGGETTLTLFQGFQLRP